MDSAAKRSSILPRHDGAAYGDGAALRLVWIVTVVFYAVLLTVLHLQLTSYWQNSTPWRLAGFEATEPFQHRILVPALVATLHALLPLGIELLFAAIEVLWWIALAVVAHSALGVLGIGSSALMRRLLALTVLVPMGVHLIVPNLHFVTLYGVDEGVIQLGEWTFQPMFHYPYDLPAAVFTLALVVLLWRFVRTRDTHWLSAYLGVFVLATLNRETTVFLIPAFVAAGYGWLDNRTLAKAALLQAAAFAAIQGSLQWVFADHANPNANIAGTHYELHVWNNLALLANPLYLVTYLARFAAGLYLPILLLHRYVDPVLGRTLLWFGVPFLISALLFGRVPEHRVVLEVIPLIWLCALQTVATWHAVRQPETAAGKAERAEGAAPSHGPAAPAGTSAVTGAESNG